MSVDRANWSFPPNLKNTRNGQSNILAILTAARNDGYALSLEYHYYTRWFDKMFLHGISWWYFSEGTAL